MKEARADEARLLPAIPAGGGATRDAAAARAADIRWSARTITSGWRFQVAVTMTPAARSRTCAIVPWTGSAPATDTLGIAAWTSPPREAPPASGSIRIASVLPTAWLGQT